MLNTKYLVKHTIKKERKKKKKRVKGLDKCVVRIYKIPYICYQKYVMNIAFHTMVNRLLNMLQYCNE